MAADPRLRVAADATRVGPVQKRLPLRTIKAAYGGRSMPPEDALSWKDFVPVLGDARSGQDFRRAVDEGHGGLAALIAGSTLVPGGKVLPKTMKSLRRGIEAWHGSPFKFNKFDLSKVGAGEGAQAYGHGLYFAEDPSVAKSYRQGLAGKFGVEGLPPIPRATSGHESLDLKSDLEQLLGISSVSPASDMIPFLRKRIGERVGRWETARPAFHGGSAVDDMDALVNWYKGHLAPVVETLGPHNVKPGGALYRVNLDVDPDELLDWDKPIGGQGVGQRATKNINPEALEEYVERMNAPPDEWAGSELYTVLKRAHLDDALPRMAEELTGTLSNSEAASKYLLNQGVPGIRYLDRGSRAAGEGTRNFVMFDPERIKILQMLGALGAINAARRKESKPDGG